MTLPLCITASGKKKIRDFEMLEEIADRYPDVVDGKFNELKLRDELAGIKHPGFNRNATKEFCDWLISTFREYEGRHYDINPNIVTFNMWRVSRYGAAFRQTKKTERFRLKHESRSKRQKQFFEEKPQQADGILPRISPQLSKIARQILEEKLRKMTPEELLQFIK